MFGFYVWYTIMHSCVFTFMHQTIFMWLWYLCDHDIWHVCSVLWIIYMSYHLCYAHLLCFRVLLWCKWALFPVLMLISYLLSTLCWLGSYKLALFFCSYCQKLIWTKHVENLISFYTLEVVLSSITKKGEIESIYAPSWVSVINDNMRLLWLERS